MVEDGDEVLCLATSRLRDKAFACATERGQLFVFDLRENNTKASLKCFRVTKRQRVLVSTQRMRTWRLCRSV